MCLGVESYPWAEAKAEERQRGRCRLSRLIYTLSEPKTDLGFVAWMWPGGQVAMEENVQIRLSVLDSNNSDEQVIRTEV